MVFDLPFLSRTPRVATKVLYSRSASGYLIPCLQGAEGFAYWENGFRQLSNSVREVKSPADVKGLKIRTMEKPAPSRRLEGARRHPTPMPFSEVFHRHAAEDD